VQRRSGGGVRAAFIGKFDATGISVSPYHAALPSRFEAIQREFEMKSGSVMRG
jgi:hypothetical protein